MENVHAEEDLIEQTTAAGEILPETSGKTALLKEMVQETLESDKSPEEKKANIGITGLPIVPEGEILHAPPHASVVVPNALKIMPGTSKIGITRKDKSESKSVTDAKKKQNKVSHSKHRHHKTKKEKKFR